MNIKILLGIGQSYILNNRIVVLTVFIYLLMSQNKIEHRALRLLSQKVFRSLSYVSLPPSIAS